MAINVDIFCPLMKDRVGSNLKSSFTVTVQRNWEVQLNIEFFEQTNYPNGFSNNWGSASAELCWLFLGFPVDQRISNHITSNRPSSIYTGPQSSSQEPWSEAELEEDNKTPRPGACLMYLTTLSAASQWDCLEACMNWLKLWTAKAMSGLVIVKYNNLPTSLWYISGSAKTGSGGPPIWWSNSQVEKKKLTGCELLI